MTGPRRACAGGDGPAALDEADDHPQPLVHRVHERRERVGRDRAAVAAPQPHHVMPRACHPPRRWAGAGAACARTSNVRCCMGKRSLCGAVCQACAAADVARAGSACVGGDELTLRRAE